MPDNQSVSSTAARYGCLRRYGPVIIVYTAMTAVTGAWFMADTNDYALEIYHYTAGLKGNFWEFGHLLWQPLGYAVFRLFGPLVGDDPHLFGVSLWKLGLFYLFLALLLINLWRTPGGRRIFHLWVLSAAPVLAFALFWQGGDMERYLALYYLALYPLTFTALAYLHSREQTGIAFRWVAAAFIAVMSYANLATMAIPALESRQQKAIARIADLNTEAKPKSLLVTPYFQDELVNFNISFPFHPINRQARWRLIDLVSPGMMETIRWRERLAVAALSAWQDGGKIWLARRALGPRPNPEWIWA